MAQQMTPRFTILIKALNEENRIAACLEAALNVACDLNGDVLLVDSLSSDRTVEIARRYPVQIVQFTLIEDRGCGAAVQLGFQYTRAPYIYVLDADMILNRAFIATALDRMDADPVLAGVGGKLVDTRLTTHSDTRRAVAASRLVAPVEVSELGGGGLYRRSAIESVGYLANRWLAAFEEAELGMRLCASGWHLLRLPDVAVSHEGHVEGNWQMMGRLWRNGRAQAGGALLRSSWRKPWFRSAVRKQAYILTIFVTHTVSLAFAVCMWSLGYPAIAGYGLGWLSYLGAMLLHKRSLSLALWNLVTWNFYAIAAVAGMRQRPRDPMLPIAAIDLTNSQSTAEEMSKLSCNRRQSPLWRQM